MNLVLLQRNQEDKSSGILPNIVIFVFSKYLLQIMKHKRRTRSSIIAHGS